LNDISNIIEKTLCKIKESLDNDEDYKRFINAKNLESMTALEYCMKFTQLASADKHIIKNLFDQNQSLKDNDQSSISLDLRA